MIDKQKANYERDLLRAEKGGPEGLDSHHFAEFSSEEEPTDPSGTYLADDEDDEEPSSLEATLAESVALLDSARARAAPLSDRIRLLQERRQGLERTLRVQEARYALLHAADRYSCRAHPRAEAELYEAARAMVTAEEGEE